MANEQASMSYQDAYDTLSMQIYAPVFFEKLASDYGIRPSTEEEARERQGDSRRSGQYCC